MYIINIIGDYILGYFFVGAVAARFNVKNKNSKIKIILVSPTIKINDSKSKRFIKIPKIFLSECSDKVKSRTFIIPNGTHEIGELNSPEVIKIIKKQKFYL